ncbi:MAG: hypothetical protein Q8O88_00775 [bacterium]|nr:hypothetical protein [bacterium]
MSYRIRVFEGRGKPETTRPVRDIEQGKSIVRQYRKENPDGYIWLEAKSVNDWTEIDVPEEEKTELKETGNWTLVTEVNLTQEHLNQISEDIKAGKLSGVLK